MDKIVADELAANNIPSDAKLAVIDTFDNNGNKITVAVKIHEDTKRVFKVAGFWEHEWDGDDTVGGKLIFVRK